MYLNTYPLPFLHTNHNPSFPAEQGLAPIHTIPGINAHLLYPWKYSIRHKLLYSSACIFGCFHGNQCCEVSCHYFYIGGILQEVDIISTVRPYRFSSPVVCHSPLSIISKCPSYPIIIYLVFPIICYSPLSIISHCQLFPHYLSFSIAYHSSLFVI